MKEKTKLVIVFIVGILMSAVISVYAATVITASEVSYTSNSNTTVQTGLDNLYTKTNTMANDVTNLKTVTNTTLTKIVGSGNIYLYKVGNIVEIRLDSYNPGTITSRTKIATIPSGSRPCVETYGVGADTSYGIGIMASPGGDLKIEKNLASKSTWLTLTYIVCS